MASKYDDFWRSQTEDLRRLIRSAALGTTGTVDVTPIAALGDRVSWYGTARVRGSEILDAQMAHLTSLARIVTEAGLCEDHSVVLKFTVDGACRLRVEVDSAAKEAIPSRERRSLPQALALRPQAQVDPSEACGRIHALLRPLETLMTPAAVSVPDGLYFFYEEGERSDHAPRGRIVRVGNHPRAAGGLRARLNNHYRSFVGAKNGSVFRRYLGGALLRRDDPVSACLLPAPGKGHWERQDDRACPTCEPCESQVTEYLTRAMRFRILPLSDREERNHFEARLVATIAGCQICRPSAAWLGRFAYNEKVQASGLWNSEFVGGQPLTGGDLSRLESLVDAATGAGGAGASADLSETLLIIPCCASKRGAPDPGLPTRSVTDFVGSESVAVLDEGRRLSFERTRRDDSSPVRPALAYYTGEPYRTAGFRSALIPSLKAGLHCIIVSGGYGLLRPEEPIHWYEAQLTHTRAIWSRRISKIIEDYVARNDIRRTFGAFSRMYASVVPRLLTGQDWRAVPEFVRGRDPGSAIRVVPEQVGAALVELLRSDFRPGADWRRS